MIGRCSCSSIAQVSSFTTGAQALHDRLAAAGVPIVAEPFDGPFGRTFSFRDPDGYVLTAHDVS
jgi:predicted enzyme related to lactoylglutathione lyase